MIAEFQHLQCNKVLMNAKDFPHVFFIRLAHFRIIINVNSKLILERVYLLESTAQNLLECWWSVEFRKGRVE